MVRCEIRVVLVSEIIYPGEQTVTAPISVVGHDVHSHANSGHSQRGRGARQSARAWPVFETARMYSGPIQPIALERAVAAHRGTPRQPPVQPAPQTQPGRDEVICDQWADFCGLSGKGE